jgi:hydrogenase maturation protease
MAQSLMHSQGCALVTRSVILGIGNVLLSDDGAGVHAVRILMDRLSNRPDVQVLDGGTLSFTLVPTIESAQRLIILDATQLELSPGSLHLFFDEQIDLLLSRRRLSVHEIGLRDVFEMMRLAESLPTERALIGIQPGSLEWGTEPTPAVAAALQVAVQRVLGLLDVWPGISTPDSRAA